MPLTIPNALTQIQQTFLDLASPGGQEAFLGTVAKALRPELHKMYDRGEDPFGSAWERKKDGGQAYRSKKMGNAIILRPHGGNIDVAYTIDWIRAADEGHVFPARQVKAESQFLTHDKNGRLVRTSRATYQSGKKQGEARRGITQTFASAHVVGQRTLTARPQEPHGRMPDGWGEAVNRGVKQGMREMFQAQKTGL